MAEGTVQESGALGGRLFSWRRNTIEGRATGAPLVVAIHGGGYGSAYFDVAGNSLLALAAANGLAAIALDRAGYGGTAHEGDVDLTHRGQADLLVPAIGALWRRFGQDAPGVVLIGHSIGGAIALDIAGRDRDWPLLGVAVSGIGLRNAPGDEAAWQALPPVPFIDFPPAMRDAKMFGPPGSFDPAMQALSHAADAPAARAELIDIVTAWPRDAAAILSRVAVPVHYRQGALDALWTVDAGEVAAFAAACTAAPAVDAALVDGTGHCIDFHHVGGAFQRSQLAFALGCAATERG